VVHRKMGTAFPKMRNKINAATVVLQFDITLYVQ